MIKHGLGLMLLACACGTSSATPDAGVDAAGVDASQVDVDASEAGCTLTGNWACVGKESLPPVTSATIDQPLQLFNFVPSGPLVNAPVKACKRDLVNASCTDAALAQTTDTNGSVTFTGLPTGTSGFDGYFEVDVANDMPNLDFVDPPIFTTFPTYNRAYWGGSVIAVLAKNAGVTLDPARGVIGIEVHDCSEFPGNVHCVEDGGCPIGKPGGVSLSIDKADLETKQAYLVNDNGAVSVSTTATCTSEGGGVSGKGGFLNVVPGAVTITAKLPDGTVAATLQVLVRANAITLVELPPTM